MNMRLKMITGWILVFVLCATGLKAGDTINFSDGLSWRQVMAKAKTEHKFIFVDCFASWCGPCKDMDETTYKDAAVVEFLRRHFVSVRFQMDSTNKDNEATKRRYADANALMREYKIAMFPSFLFFSPNGKIVHRDFGYLDSAGFLSLLNNSLDPAKQYYTLLAAYDKGRRDYPSIRYLVGLARRFREKRLAADLSRDYLRNYLYKLTDEELYSRKNISFMVTAIETPEERGFKLLYGHETKVDEIVGERKFTERIVGGIIYNAEVYPVLWNDEKPVREKPDWEALKGTLASRYTDGYVEWIMLEARMRWYYYMKDWQQLASCCLEKLEREGIDSTDRALGSANNILYLNVFKQTPDTNVLNRALKLASVLVSLRPYDGVYIDTYANFLYKLGRKKDAIKWEDRALRLEPENKEIKENFLRMKNGESTWSDK